MSTMTPTDRLMQTLKMQLPGATDDMLKLVLFNVVDEFFRKTNAWRYEDQIDLSIDLREYDWHIPPSAMVVRVMGLTHNGIPMRAMTPEESGITISSVGTILPDLTFPDGDALYDADISDNVGGIFTFAIYTPAYVSFSTTPDLEAIKHPIKAWLALTMTRTCLECECDEWGIPEWMYDTYFTDWENGMLAKMFSMPAKPWSNEKLAIFHGRRFRANIAFRKQEIDRGFTYNTPSWSFPSGWGAGRR